MPKQMWYPEEDAVMTRYYPSEGVVGCLRRLTNRGQRSVEKRAQKLGLRLTREARSKVQSRNAQRQHQKIRQYRPKPRRGWEIDEAAVMQRAKQSFELLRAWA